MPKILTTNLKALSWATQPNTYFPGGSDKILSVPKIIQYAVVQYDDWQTAGETLEIKTRWTIKWDNNFDYTTLIPALPANIKNNWSLNSTSSETDATTWALEIDAVYSYNTVPQWFSEGTIQLDADLRQVMDGEWYCKEYQMSPIRYALANDTYFISWNISTDGWPYFSKIVVYNYSTHMVETSFCIALDDLAYIKTGGGGTWEFEDTFSYWEHYPRYYASADAFIADIYANRLD